MVDLIKKGQYIQAWNGDWAKGWAIIDTMMNLSLLYWASKETIDNKYKEVAIKCADTVLKHLLMKMVQLDILLCLMKKVIKKVLKVVKDIMKLLLGRGTAWALYGLTITYREKRRKIFKCRK